MLPLAPAHPQKIGSEVKLGVNIVHDDNLLRANKQRGGTRGAGDTRITPSLGLDLSHRRGRHLFYLKGSAGYDFHRRNEQLDAERIVLDGGGNFALGPWCEANLSAAIDFRQSDIAELGVVTSNRTRSRTFSGRLGCPRPAGLYPQINVSRIAVDNSSRTRSLFDLRMFGAGGSLVYARPSLGTIALYYGYSLLERPAARDPATGQQDTTRVHRAGVRFDRDVAARLGASLALGAVDANPRLPTTRGFSGVDWLGEIRWRPSLASSVTTRFQREIRGESNFGASYLVADGIAIETRLSLSARTGIEFHARHEKRRLRGEEPVAGQPARQSDKTARIGASLKYQLTPSLLLGSDLGYTRRDAANAFYDYRSTVGGVSANYRF